MLGWLFGLIMISGFLLLWETVFISPLLELYQIQKSEEKSGL